MTDTGTPEFSDDDLAFIETIFEQARSGNTAELAAIFRNNEPIVSALLAAGVDPSLGAHTAQAVAHQFGLTAMQELLG